MDNDTTEGVKTSGYDLGMYGIENDTFYYVHIPALICMFASFTCVVITLTLTFKRKGEVRFFDWSQIERFVVYLALCDGTYNVFHFVDHLQVVIQRDHVYPKQLCEFYGFGVAVFIIGQYFMVISVAVTAFILVFFDTHPGFGRRDWKLFAWAFGPPFVAAIMLAVLGKLGPNGAFCFFDGVKGGTANTYFITVPLLIVLTINLVMFILTWYKIRQRTKMLPEASHDAQSANSKIRTAKGMSLFVIDFYIQWWALTVFEVWALVGIVPQVVFHLVTIFCNIGGCLNLVVFLLLVRMGLVGKGLNSFPKRRPMSHVEDKTTSL